MIKRMFLPFLLVIFLLPILSHPDYRLVAHTTSQLGGQQMPYAWVMNLTFFSMGAAVLVDAYMTKKWPLSLRFLLTVFGLSFFMTGVFQTRSIDSFMAYDPFSDTLHSVFATATGVSFALFATTVFVIAQKKQQKIAAFLLLVVSIGIPLLMQFSDFSGILQRIMMILAFSWMIVLLQKPERL